MEPDARTLVQAVHDCTSRLVMVTAGAGTQALADLLGVPGASRTLLEALIPYSTASFDEFLGQTPQQYVAQETGRLMAGRAFTRARWLSDEPWPCVGLACTATIITDRPKRGEHRAHIATWQPARMICYELHLDKGRRDRSGEENLVSRTMLNALAHACGVPQQLELALGPGDALDITQSDFAAMADRLLTGALPYFGVLDNGRLRTADAMPQVILPGAFNPLHEGHIELAHVAMQVLGKPVAFELSATNVDKPPLEPELLLERLAQFAGRYPVFATDAPTFLAKARIFPGVAFVVGYDTAVRVLHPRYYDNDPAQMLAALHEMRDLGCQFVVAGRVDDNGTFFEVDDLDVPPGLSGLFSGISGRRFRKDISSTELRLTGRKGSR